MTAADRTTFRPDIEGLRGLAILLVVAYHIHLPGVTGGYIGVDVFFVLSGYLITSLLLAEIGRTGRLQLGRFYARRIRRLLPAAATVLFFTLLVGWLIEPPVAQGDLGSSGLSTALYVSNLWFARNAVDYLAEDSKLNPLLHTWSLSVEEQFYLVWPVLVLVAARGFGSFSRARLFCVMAIMAVLSLAGGVWLTGVAQPWAFFGSPARAWEFAAGAMATVVPASTLAVRPALRSWGSVLGLMALVAAAFMLDSRSTFPGIATITPVVATVAVLMAGSSAEGHVASGLLSSSPLQWIGRMSYGWYLWHWPVLVFAASFFGPLSVPTQGLLALVALAMASLMYVALENPIRFSRFLTARTGMTLAMGLALTAATTLTAGWLRAAGLEAAADPVQSRFQQARDVPRVYHDGCHLAFIATTNPDCVYGDPQSSTVIVLFGDSHAAQWFPALDAAAKSHHWKLVSWTKSACPAAVVEMQNPQLGRDYPECTTWRESIIARIEALRPAAVVISSYSGYFPHDGRSSDWGVTLQAWETGTEGVIRLLTATGSRVLLVLDSPEPAFDVPKCLSRAAWTRWTSRENCDFAPTVGLHPAVRRLELEAAARTGVDTFDPIPWICADELCEAEREGLVVYRDTHHLSEVFATTLSGPLGRHVQPLLARDASLQSDANGQLPVPQPQLSAAGP